MEALFFNVRLINPMHFLQFVHTGTRVQVDNGFLEGIVRGYKAGLLTQNQYSNLTQCETIEGAFVLPSSHCRILNAWHIMQDFRTQLSSTDYGNFLANEPLPISTSTIADKATQVLVDQFNFLRSNAVAPLSKFFDFITYAFPACSPVTC